MRVSIGYGNWHRINLLFIAVLCVYNFGLHFTFRDKKCLLVVRGTLLFELQQVLFMPFINTGGSRLMLLLGPGKKPH